ncbi:DUF5956 family protein [Micromonospora sp. DT201]|uniref:DUF5956 family protein n=1 Tax=Micromonospora sp. DT201 TaxID=3393442 RepID=UPI003CED7B66
MDIAYDWGLDEPANPVADRAGEAAGLTPEQLPEVRELTARGWQLAPDAPLYAFLPAVWPRKLRTWVPDRATSYDTCYEQDPKTHTVLPTQTRVAGPAEIDEDHDWTLARVGITGRPRGRLWLLKPPHGYDSVDALLDEVWQRAQQQGIEATMNEPFVELTARTVRNDTATP